MRGTLYPLIIALGGAVCALALASLHTSSATAYNIVAHLHTLAATSPVSVTLVPCSPAAAAFAQPTTIAAIAAASVSILGSLFAGISAIRGRQAIQSTRSGDAVVIPADKVILPPGATKPPLVP